MLLFLFQPWRRHLNWQHHLHYISHVIAYNLAQPWLQIMFQVTAFIYISIKFLEFINASQIWCATIYNFLYFGRLELYQQHVYFSHFIAYFSTEQVLRETFNSVWRLFILCDSNVLQHDIEFKVTFGRRLSQKILPPPFFTQNPAILRWAVTNIALKQCKVTTSDSHLKCTHALTAFSSSRDNSWMTCRHALAQADTWTIT